MEVTIVRREVSEQSSLGRFKTESLSRGRKLTRESDSSIQDYSTFAASPDLKRCR